MFRNIYSAALNKESEERLLNNRLAKAGRIEVSRRTWWQRTKAAVFQAVGIFPAPAISTLKSIPIIKSFVKLFSWLRGVETRSAKEVFEQDYQGQNDDKTLEAKQSVIAKTELIPNGDQRLETFSFEHQTFAAKPPSSQYYRVHSSSNTGNCSRFFEELSTLSKENPNLKTITYNHPDVEQSTGSVRSHRVVVNAVVAQIRFLVEEKYVRPQNIILTGFSIGGASANHAYTELKKIGITGVKLYADRTFSTMETVIKNNAKVASKVLNVPKQLRDIDWEMKPAEHYQTVPAKDRSVVNVKLRTLPARHKPQVAVMDADGKISYKDANNDKTIPYAPSLHNSTKDSYEETKAILFRLKSGVPAAEEKQLIAELKAHANDAIIYNVALRLENGKLTPEQKTDLIYQGIVALKSQRLDGTVEEDAHNVSALKIKCRNINKIKDKTNRWLSPNETYTGMLRGALRSSGMTSEAEKPHLHQLSAFTRFTMFFKAIVNNNSIEEAKLAAEADRAEKQRWADYANSL